MKKNNGAKIDILPNSEDLTVWQNCLKKAILETQAKACSYLHKPATDPHAGCTEDIFFQGQRVMQARRPEPKSHCVGANLEVFWRAWNEWTKNLPKEYNLTQDKAKELRAHFFAYKDNENSYAKGARGGLLYLSEVLPWLEVEDNSEGQFQKDLVQFGDVFSIQSTPDPMASGHSTIFIKNWENWENKGKDVAIVWSSNSSYDKSLLCQDQEAGHGFDWYNYQRKYSSGFWRKLHTAGIRNFGWPEENI